MNNKNVKWASSLIYKKGTLRMTVIAGIKFSAGVVIASDCQATMGNILKKTDKRKISEIEDMRNLSFCFAGAGDERLIKRAKEQLILECQNREVGSLLEFKDTCEDVVKFIKNRYIDDKNVINRDEEQYPDLEFLVGVAIQKDMGGEEILVY